jgi:hypothetical protein
MDSVDIRVTSSGGALLFSTGRRLQRYDTSATLPVEVPAGVAVFSAQILSSNGSTLFSGSTTQNVASDGLAVVVQLTENRPVLVVLPDTAKTTDTFRTSFTVYNGGTDSLTWGLQSADAPFDNCGRFCQFLPRSGTIGPKQQMLITAQLFIAVPSGVFSFVLRSPEGDVRVWWQYTLSQTGRVTGANLLWLDQQVRVR